MVIEGRGHVAPAKDRYRFVVSDREFKEIVDGAKGINRYENRSDTWGKGLMNSALAIRLGLSGSELSCSAGKIGEYAVLCFAERRFGKIFPPIDFAKKATGDGGIDLDLKGVLIQVKTRCSKNQIERQTNLVRTSDPLNGHATVFCEWEPTGLISFVVGWIRNTDLRSAKVSQSPVGPWTNREVNDRELLPLNRLWSEIEMRVNR